MNIDNTFIFEALDNKGHQTSGQIPAENEAQAIIHLRAIGLYPTKITKGGRITDTVGSMKKKSTISFFRIVIKVIIYLVIFLAGYLTTYFL